VKVYLRFLLVASLAIASECPLPSFAQGANHLKSSDQVFNVDAHETPKILEADYIDLSQIISISRFRSSEGHDYSDSFESCRSMKHYFKPGPEADWATVKIFSPVTGVVIRTEEESAGTKIEIQPFFPHSQNLSVVDMYLA